VEAALLARRANTKYQMAVLNVLVVWLASIQLLLPQTFLKRAKIVLQTQTRQKPAPAAHPVRAMQGIPDQTAEAALPVARGNSRLQQARGLAQVAMRMQTRRKPAQAACLACAMQDTQDQTAEAALLVGKENTKVWLAVLHVKVV